MVAVHVVASNRPLAARRSCGGTSDLRNAPPAAPKVISAAETTTETTSSWAKESRSRAYATGMLINAVKRARSIAIMTGRLRRKSTHGPSGNATAAPTARPAAASAATSAAPACSTRIAIRGKAPNASRVPKVLIAYADHSHANSRPSDRLAPMPSTPLAAAPRHPRSTGHIKATSGSAHQTTARFVRYNQKLYSQRTA